MTTKRLFLVLATVLFLFGPAQVLAQEKVTLDAPVVVEPAIGEVQVTLVILDRLHRSVFISTQYATIRALPDGSNWWTF